MIKLSVGAGQVIASDVTTAFQSTDNALLDTARLTASVLEGTATSGLNPRAKQRLLESIGSSFDRMLESRKEMVRAHSQMVVLQSQSNIAEVNFGCYEMPDGQPFFTGASADQTVEAQKASS